MRLPTQWRLNSPLPGRARRGKTHGFGYPQRTPWITTLGSKSCCCPLSSAQRFVSRRAEMVPPNPGLRTGARRLVRRALAPADHATPRAGPAFGTFASAKAPKRSIPSLTTLTQVTRAAAWPTPESGRLPSTSATNVDVIYMRGGTVRSHRHRRRRCRGARAGGDADCAAPVRSCSTEPDRGLDAGHA
jgi:hypothetical protein